MNLCPSHAPRRGPASPRRAWVRWVTTLLALSVALQGSVIAMTRATGPAHFHVLPPSATDAASDPMLDAVRVVKNHHGSGLQAHRHDTLIERHQHDPDRGDVVTLDDDAAPSDAAKNPAGKRAVADLNTPPVTLDAASVVSVIAPTGAPTASTFDSHIDDLLDRPPR